MKKVLFSESQRNRILGEAQGYVEGTYEASAKILERSYALLKRFAKLGYTKEKVLSSAENMKKGDEYQIQRVGFNGKSLGWPYSSKVYVFYSIMPVTMRGAYIPFYTKVKDSKFNIADIAIVLNLHSLYTIPKENMQSIIAHELSHAYNEIRAIQKNRSEYAGSNTTSKDTSFLDDVEDVNVKSFFYLLSPEEERASVSQLMTELNSLYEKGLLSGGNIYDTVFTDGNTRVGSILERYNEWIDTFSDDNETSMEVTKGLIKAYYNSIWKTSNLNRGKQPMPAVRNRHGQNKFMTNYRKRILYTLISKREHLIKKAKQVIDSYFIRKAQK